MEIIKTNCGYCEKEFEYTDGLSHFNRTKKHYCSRDCQNVRHGMGRRGIKKDDRYKIWCSASKRAKENNIIFSLEPNDIPNIPDICPILGINIKKNTIAGPLDSSPSIDRIKPELGYIVGNIRIISNRANRLRSDANTKELFNLYKDSLTILGE